MGCEVGRARQRGSGRILQRRTVHRDVQGNREKITQMAEGRNTITSHKGQDIPASVSSVSSARPISALSATRRLPSGACASSSADNSGCVGFRWLPFKASGAGSLQGMLGISHF